MARLDKKLTLYDRDEKGKLIPQEVKLELDEIDAAEFPELKNMTVCVTPMTRGEIKRIFNLSGAADETKPETTKDADGELILEHCHDPAFTKEDVAFLKPVFTRSIVATICRESGIKLGKSGKKLDKDSDEFGKNS